MMGVAFPTPRRIGANHPNAVCASEDDGFGRPGGVGADPAVPPPASPPVAAELLPPSPLARRALLCAATAVAAGLAAAGGAAPATLPPRPCGERARTPYTCRVSELAIAAAGHIAAYDAAEETALSAQDALRFVDPLDEIEKEALSVPALSGRGAMYQLLLSYDHIRAVADGECREELQQHYLDAAVRGLRSAIEVLAIGIPHDQGVREWYCPPWVDPARYAAVHA